MSATARLAAFATALVVVFGGGWALGSAVGPFDQSAPSSRHTPATTEPDRVHPDGIHPHDDHSMPSAASGGEGG